MPKSIKDHHVEAVLAKDGTLTLDHLPFHAGDAGEVIVRPTEIKSDGASQNKYPLHGMKVKYERPFDPVGDAGGLLAAWCCTFDAQVDE